jgi:hypothetical protein
MALRGDFVYRDYRNFYVQRDDTSTGVVIDSRPGAPASVRGRVYDLAVVENTDLLKRRYAGLTTQAQYRFGTRFDVGANYTLSRLWGNVDGETVNGGPSASDILTYPEYKQEAWYYPEGDLSGDQRHRARLWANYGIRWVSGLTLSLLEDIGSGVPYGAASGTGVDPRLYVANPGYLTPPSGQNTTYYFTARDAFRTEGPRRTDVAANYSYRLRRAANLELFGQLQVLNLFNQFQLCGCGATVFLNGGAIRQERIDQTVLTPVTTARLQPFNPFTTTPAQGGNWDYGTNFGKALNRFAYSSPRTLRLSFGVRF